MTSTRFCALAGLWSRALIAPAIVFIATCMDRSYNTDFWHHLARGQYIVANGRMLDEDLFTCTVHGQHFQDNNWLSQVLFAHLFALGGLPLVQTVNSLVVAAKVGVLVWFCYRKSGSLPLASALGVFAFFGLWQLLIIRPQSFSLLLFVALYVVLDASERRPWLLVIPPFLLALWSNLHGGFPIGLVLIGVFVMIAAGEAIGEKRWASWQDHRTWLLVACLLVSGVATFANPYGWEIYRYVRTTSSLASARRIDEWVPPSLGMLVGQVFVLSVLFMLVLLALPTRRPRFREVILVLCFLPLACGSVRMVTWWMLISMPVAATLIADNLPRRWLAESDPNQASWLDPVFLGLLLAAMVFAAPPLEPYNRALPLIRNTHRTEYDLEKVTNHIEKQGGGRVFSRFEWGEYLGWALGPRGRIFMDARIEIYPDSLWEEYSAVTRGRADWQKILDRYDVEWLVLDRRYHADLLPQVAQSSSWAEVDLDAGEVLLYRRTGAGKAGGESPLTRKTDNR